MSGTESSRGSFDFVKDDPSIFLHAFTFADPDIASLADMDGIISYTVPPPEVMKLFRRKRRPPLVAITMRASNEPIKTLVARSGFGDMSQATRSFKARFGQSMSAYRASRQTAV